MYRWIALCALTLFTLLPGVAHADVQTFVTPILGRDAPPGDSWGGVIVRIENRETKALKGKVEAKFGASYGRSADGFAVEAPINIGAGDAGIVHLPVHGTGSYELKVSVKDENNKEVTTETLRTLSSAEPTLIEVVPTPRLGAHLRGTKLSIRTGTSSTRSSIMAVGAPFFSTPVDPILPERAAEYGGATVVVIPSDVLSRLTGPALDALVGWVLSGGTLATYIVRPEDLRSPTVLALVGGDLKDIGKPAHLTRFSSKVIEKDGSSSAPTYEDDHPVKPAPGKPPVKPSPQLKLNYVMPRPEVAENMVAYEGGNLIRSDFGASAAYGLGEVHVLPFNLLSPQNLDDPWVHSRMAELVRYAWDRRLSVCYPQGAQNAIDSSIQQDIRKQLDPNQSARWAILVAALLLFGYSFIAGPLNFMTASRVHRPLRALPILFGLSAATFGLVLMLGMMAKGCRGESQRLSMIEASGGMPRATIRRFRGFFTPGARTMTVSASEPGALLDVIGEPETRPTMTLDRGVAKLEGVATLPWQTIVVREDALVSLGGGVSLVRMPGGDVQITNRSARNLRGLVAFAPGLGLYFLPELKDGASVVASTGTRLSVGKTMLSYSGAGSATSLSVSVFRKQLESVSPGLADAWAVFERRSSAYPVDWWPDEVPVLIAQVDGGEGYPTDGGLRVSKDRTLLRVLGYGGTP